MTYVDLPPDDYRDVEVQTDDGLWHPGRLQAYRQVEGVWSAFVRYSTGPGENRLGWFEEPRIRSAKN